MSTVFDRINTELEQVGERLRSVLSEGRRQAERGALLAARSRVAARLGHLAYAKERGKEFSADELQETLVRMDQLNAQIEALGARPEPDAGPSDSSPSDPDTAPVTESAVPADESSEKPTQQETTQP